MRFDVGGSLINDLTTVLATRGMNETDQKYRDHELSAAS
jgi:hypothetical protein